MGEAAADRRGRGRSVGAVASGRTRHHRGRRGVGGGLVGEAGRRVWPGGPGDGGVRGCAGACDVRERRRSGLRFPSPHLGNKKNRDRSARRRQDPGGKRGGDGGVTVMGGTGMAGIVEGKVAIVTGAAAASAAPSHAVGPAGRQGRGQRRRRRARWLRRRCGSGAAGRRRDQASGRAGDRLDAVDRRAAERRPDRAGHARHLQARRHPGQQRRHPARPHFSPHELVGLVRRDLSCICTARSA